MGPLLEWSATMLCAGHVHVLLAFYPDRHHLPGMLTVFWWRLVRHHFVVRICRGANRVVNAAFRSLLQARLDGYREFRSGEDELIATAHLVNDRVECVAWIANRANCSLFRHLH